MGVFRYFNPPLPPYRGKFSGFAELAFMLGGKTGIAILWFLVAGGLLCLARSIWRRTAKLPSDHLL